MTYCLWTIIIWTLYKLSNMTINRWKHISQWRMRYICVTKYYRVIYTIKCIYVIYIESNNTVFVTNIIFQEYIFQHWWEQLESVLTSYAIHSTGQTSDQECEALCVAPLLSRSISGQNIYVFIFITALTYTTGRIDTCLWRKSIQETPLGLSPPPNSIF